MFGYMNFADHRNNESLAMGRGSSINGCALESERCEIAVWNKEGTKDEGWPGCHYGIASYQTADQLANVIAWVAAQKPCESKSDFYALVEATNRSKDEHF